MKAAGVSPTIDDCARTPIRASSYCRHSAQIRTCRPGPQQSIASIRCPAAACLRYDMSDTSAASRFPYLTPSTRVPARTEMGNEPGYVDTGMRDICRRARPPSLVASQVRPEFAYDRKSILGTTPCARRRSPRPPIRVLNSI